MEETRCGAVCPGHASPMLMLGAGCSLFALITTSISTCPAIKKRGDSYDTLVVRPMQALLLSLVTELIGSECTYRSL
jgi:hypothetical protein